MKQLTKSEAEKKFESTLENQFGLEDNYIYEGDIKENNKYFYYDCEKKLQKLQRYHLGLEKVNDKLPEITTNWFNRFSTYYDYISNTAGTGVELIKNNSKFDESYYLYILKEKPYDCVLKEKACDIIKETKESRIMVSCPKCDKKFVVNGELGAYKCECGEITTMD